MKVYDTLSGKKEEFLPQGSEVKMYVCGLTPYDRCHVGHAMSYLVFDIVHRYLEFRGYRVKYVQNFTDVDDKIIARANELGIPFKEVAERFIEEYFADMDALNIKRADIYPRATQEISDIIQAVKGLVDKGYAYEASGNVYFRVKSFPDYGKLSHCGLEEFIAESRVEAGEGKQDPFDFALWKGSKPGEPWWESPWGKGRPGWHIECSVMSLKYLGETLDIHGGGRDLIFPHHENELAQSECFTGKSPFVRYWLHNGLMQLGEDKMSKSTGKLVTVKEMLQKYSSDALRMLVLSSHYRSPITYSEEKLDAAERAVERLRHALTSGEGELPVEIDLEGYKQKFIKAMDDDFNTARALGVLFDLAREINREREKGAEMNSARQTLKELAGVLGLTLEERVEDLGPAAPFIELLISVRDELRKERNFPLADEIRSRLKEQGIKLEDTPKGTIWRREK